MSSSACQYGCVDGRIFNAYTKEFEICPDCQEKRKKEAFETNTSEEKLSDRLGFSEVLNGIEYDFDNLLMDKENIEGESLRVVQEYLDNMYIKAKVGDFPKYSRLFNLGLKADLMRFVAPYLRECYIYGVKVAPLVSTLELCNLRIKAEREGEDPNAEWGKDYTHFINAEICVVIVDSGITMNGGQVLRGLMQARARYGKATYLFTDSKFTKPLNLIITDVKDTKHLAYVIGVKYRKDADVGEAGEQGTVAEKQEEVRENKQIETQLSTLSKPMNNL